MMLVITRKLKDSLTILKDGKPILEVTPIAKHGDQIQIGLIAGKEYQIMRNELLPDSSKIKGAFETRTDLANQDKFQDRLARNKRDPDKHSKHFKKKDWR